LPVAVGEFGSLSAPGVLRFAPVPLSVTVPGVAGAAELGIDPVVVPVDPFAPFVPPTTPVVDPVVPAAAPGLAPVVVVCAIASVPLRTSVPATAESLANRFITNLRRARSLRCLDPAQRKHAAEAIN
jgi:hypothetical protein